MRAAAEASADQAALGRVVHRGRLAAVVAHRRGGRPVAVKQALPVPGAAEALHLEWRTLTAVRHPNLVPVLDLAGVGGPCPAMTMAWAPSTAVRLVAGGTGGAPPPDHHAPSGAGPVLAGVADGLAALHGVGVCHGDLSPANVLLGPAGAVWLADPAPPGAGTPGFSDPAGGLAGDVFGFAALAEALVPGLRHGPAGPVVTAALDERPASRPGSVGEVHAAVSAAMAPRAAASGTGTDRWVPPPGGEAALARTWPFERWAEQEEALQRLAAAAVEPGSEPPPQAVPRGRGRPVVAAALVAAGGLLAAAGLCGWAPG